MQCGSLSGFVTTRGTCCPNWRIDISEDGVGALIPQSMRGACTGFLHGPTGVYLNSAKVLHRGDGNQNGFLTFTRAGDDTENLEHARSQKLN